ncbi:hypothetical protein HPO96_22115 [Kribbella sandramycini]|uniref:Fibronectin type-III domain-containing protein n=1 Tax=Kribbella sandramycini TaxID=60450 RepID=A0A7Y4L4B9_9ACTN|nr:hypothetical protein [Kribbella sandramycini]MBB6566394.1 hypothetical protein [Kribbella sandramycini]NOL42946.1 hypothetical protein [Kribbella sandramycini]
MRKLVVTAVTAALLTAVLPAPAWAAAPTAAAVVWSPDRDLRLSWSDDGGPNTIWAEYETRIGPSCSSR